MGTLVGPPLEVAVGVATVSGGTRCHDGVSVVATSVVHTRALLSLSVDVEAGVFDAPRLPLPARLVPRLEVPGFLTRAPALSLAVSANQLQLSAGPVELGLRLKFSPATLLQLLEEVTVQVGTGCARAQQVALPWASALKVTATATAWMPDLRVDLMRTVELHAQIETGASSVFNALPGMEYLPWAVRGTPAGGPRSTNVLTPVLGSRPVATHVGSRFGPPALAPPPTVAPGQNGAPTAFNPVGAF